MRSTRLYLVAAVCFSAGIAAGSFARRPEPPREEPPGLELLEGTLTCPPGHELAPLSVRVDDEIRQVGRPSCAAPAVAVFHIRVSGKPVVATYEVHP